MRHTTISEANASRVATYPHVRQTRASMLTPICHTTEAEARFARLTREAREQGEARDALVAHVNSHAGTWHTSEPTARDRQRHAAHVAQTRKLVAREQAEAREAREQAQAILREQAEARNALRMRYGSRLIREAREHAQTVAEAQTPVQRLTRPYLCDVAIIDGVAHVSGEPWHLTRDLRNLVRYVRDVATRETVPYRETAQEKADAINAQYVSSLTSRPWRGLVPAREVRVSARGASGIRGVRGMAERVTSRDARGSEQHDSVLVKALVTVGHATPEYGQRLTPEQAQYLTREVRKHPAKCTVRVWQCDPVLLTGDVATWRTSVASVTRTEQGDVIAVSEYGYVTERRAEPHRGTVRVSREQAQSDRLTDGAYEARAKRLAWVAAQTQAHVD